MEKNAIWVEAMLDWIAENRPTEIDSFRAMIEQGLAPDALILLAHVGFEAGRKYQHDNPDAELGPLT